MAKSRRAFISGRPRWRAGRSRAGERSAKCAAARQIRLEHVALPRAGDAPGAPARVFYANGDGLRSVAPHPLRRRGRSPALKSTVLWQTRATFMRLEDEGFLTMDVR
jgi:hypothetical protein